MNAVDELIRLYAKQLKIPSFAEYQEVLRQADPSAGFSDLLLELMKVETASRQENQNRRRLKAVNRPLSSRQVKKEKLRHEGLVPVSKGSQAL